MKERRVIITVICAAALFVLVLAWMIYSGSANSPGGIVITFGRYVRVRGTNTVFFDVTNRCTVPIGIMIGPAAVKLSNGWPDTLLTTNFGTSYVLNPSEGLMFWCTPPTNSGMWRVPIIYFRRTTELGWKIEKNRDLLGLRRLHVPGIRGAFYMTNSPAITESPPAPSATNISSSGN